MRIPRGIRALLLTTALSLALAPAAGAYSWERLVEDFKFKPVAFIVAIPAFIITAPFMLVGAALEAGEEESE